MAEREAQRGLGELDAIGILDRLDAAQANLPACMASSASAERASVGAFNRHTIGFAPWSNRHAAPDCVRARSFGACQSLARRHNRQTRRAGGG